MVPVAVLVATIVLWAGAAAAQPPQAPRPHAAGGVKSIAAGGGHSCAVLANGTVRCWGLNTDGQLGYGERLGTPVAVPGVAGARAIAAGPAHTCAVLGDGRVMCWGSNARGQLGRAPIERGGIFPAATVVAGIAGAAAVAAGRDHTCALLRDGTVRCWGGNHTGQLGDGTTEHSPAPVAVRGITDAVGLAAGRFHACAVLRNGTARCWGANGAGQLGTRSPENSPVPVTVEALASVAAIVAGHAHTCALSTDHTVHCWGSNEAGQLGNHGASSATPVAVVEAAGAVALGAGGTQSCAVLPDGTQRCWGTDGPPGVERVTFALRTPTPLTTPGIAGAATVAPGLAHNCILLRSGAARCRGNNSEGQLGDGTFQNSRPPVEVAGLGQARALASGDAHTCALLADGGVRCWGGNTAGQLGRAITEFSPAAVAVAGLAGATAAAAGDAHVCALLGDGTLRCWGRNRDGQLGRGWAGPASFRAELVIELPKATAVAAGGDFTCALLAEGTVRCWGHNGRGQLGDGTTRSSTLPVAVRGVAGVAAIAAGVSQACAVLALGGVMCWGQAGPRDAGDRGPSGPSSHSLPALAVPGLLTAATVAAGENFTCAVRRDSTLVCWGANGMGQLGTPEVRGIGQPIMVTGVAYPVAVAAGTHHACALRRDGHVRCWGRSHLGQLGRGAVAESSAVPVTVQGIENAVAVTAGAAHACALIADGAIKCWGSNETAQLGRDPAQRFSHTPITIEVGR